MTMTLGKALTAGNDDAVNLDHAAITSGYNKATRQLDETRKKTDRNAPGTETLNDSLKKALMGALDIALDDILGQAWSGWTELREYADPEQTAPEDINVVSVGNHTVTSAHKPSVGVYVHGVRVHSFDFEVAAQFEVQGVNLQVQGGNITQIEMGKLMMGGSIALGDRTILEKTLAEIPIPGVMRLSKPMPILWGST